MALTTGEAIGVLRAIELKVLEYDIPSPGDCPEYRGHHEACLDILQYIRRYRELIKQYDGIPRIQDMYPTMHITLFEDSDPVPVDPDEYLKREVTTDGIYIEPKRLRQSRRNGGQNDSI